MDHQPHNLAAMRDGKGQLNVSSSLNMGVEPTQSSMVGL